MKKINIWMGGLFSPPTLRDIKIAYNTATYISSIHKNSKIKLYMVPTNKYYNSPMTVCVSEKNRLKMLHLLLNYVKESFHFPKNIEIVVSKIDIDYGKKYKTPTPSHESIKKLENTTPFYKIFNLDNVINIVNANWDNYTNFGFKQDVGFSINFLLSDYTIVIPTFSENSYSMSYKEKYDFIYKNIDLSKLLKNKINIPSVLKNKGAKEQKDIIMKHIIILPDKYVPENLKSISSKKVIQELDNYYNSLQKINELSSKKVTKYILKNNLYKNCYEHDRKKTKKRNSKSTPKHNKTIKRKKKQ